MTYNKDNYNKYKESHRKSWVKRQARNSEFVVEYKMERGCQICGYNKCVKSLQFHHLKSDEKEGNISRMVGQGASLERVIAEVEKCVVLCANCHGELHAGMHQI